jgi:rhodanese-related sulfurtransferase
MLPFLLIGVIAVVVVFFVLCMRIRRERLEIDSQSITPDALHELLIADPLAMILDVRVPLDVLAAMEIIPGAKRITPKEIEQNADVVPRDREVIVYCTCRSDRTAREITKRARALKFFRVKFLKGGLEAWKLKGYPVEPYRETFHLDTAT